MTIDIDRKLLSLFTEEQLQTAIEETVKFAKEKHANVLEFYDSYSKKDDNFVADYKELLANSKWENFLPKEYYVLKNLQDVKKRKVS